jgi:L-ascorbate metabolism protein UlaG (beta-lactamase superfamily)
VDLQARCFVPMHWGTFRLTQEPMDEPPTRLLREWERLGLPRHALKLLGVGESTELTPNLNPV